MTDASTQKCTGPFIAIYRKNVIEIGFHVPAFQTQKLKEPTRIEDFVEDMAVKE